MCPAITLEIGVHRFAEQFSAVISRRMLTCKSIRFAIIDSKRLVAHIAWLVLSRPARNESTSIPTFYCQHSITHCNKSWDNSSQNFSPEQGNKSALLGVPVRNEKAHWADLHYFSPSGRALIHLTEKTSTCSQFWRKSENHERGVNEKA